PADMAEFACAAGGGAANGRAAEGAVGGPRIDVLPRPIHPSGAGGPGGVRADRIGGLTRQPHDVAVVIEVGAVVEGDADHERALPERVVHGALECRHGARALTLLALAASAD